MFNLDALPLAPLAPYYTEVQVGSRAGYHSGAILLSGYVRAASPVVKATAARVGVGAGVVVRTGPDHGVGHTYALIK